MNVEPLPKEEDKFEKYVSIICEIRNHPFSLSITYLCRSTPNGVRRWGQGRLLEVEEEDYFNADDDEDEILPVLGSPSLPRTTGSPGPAANPPRRKRSRGSGIPIRPSRPPLSSRTPPLGSLVDYEDNDDLGGISPIEEPSTMTGPPTSASSGAPTRSAGGLIPNLASFFSVSPVPSQQQQDPQTTPRFPHRPISLSTKITSPISTPTVPSIPGPTPEDETDNVLDSLVFGTGPPSPSIAQSRPFELGVGIAGGMKRRREDEDEEMMERLVNKSKRPTVFSKEKKLSHNEGPGRIASTLGCKGSEDSRGGGVLTGIVGGAKKIKLKLTSSSTSNISSSPSSTGAKDGDGG